MKQDMKNMQCMVGKLEPKWLGPSAIVGVKESGGYIVKDKYSKLKKVIPIDQGKLYSNN